MLQELSRVKAGLGTSATRKGFKMKSEETIVARVERGAQISAGDLRSLVEENDVVETKRLAVRLEFGKGATLEPLELLLDCLAKHVVRTAELELTVHYGYRYGGVAFDDDCIWNFDRWANYEFFKGIKHLQVQAHFGALKFFELFSLRSLKISRARITAPTRVPFEDPSFLRWLLGLSPTLEKLTLNNFEFSEATLGTLVVDILPRLPNLRRLRLQGSNDVISWSSLFHWAATSKKLTVLEIPSLRASSDFSPDSPRFNVNDGEELIELVRVNRTITKLLVELVKFSQSQIHEFIDAMHKNTVICSVNSAELHQRIEFSWLARLNGYLVENKRLHWSPNDAMKSHARMPNVWKDTIWCLLLMGKREPFKRLDTYVMYEIIKALSIVWEIT